MPEPLQVVCMLVGKRYPDVYVHRLASMLHRHAHVPFSLWCVVDRPRRLPPGVRAIDASRWSGTTREGMRLTTHKLKLFDPETFPFDEFLYLDVTLVIQRDLRPMLDYGFGLPHDLVIVKDWNYDCYNSCVMRIRSGPALRGIYQAFLDGKTYPRRNPGDQDFIHAAVKDLGIEDRVAFWRPDDVVSYRNLRKLHRTDPAAAYEAIAKGTIVKFYGTPKMHQMKNPFYRYVIQGLKHPRVALKDARFWMPQLKQHWR